jgi:hypothetical protein
MNTEQTLLAYGQRRLDNCFEPHGPQQAFDVHLAQAEHEERAALNKSNYKLKKINKFFSNKNLKNRHILKIFKTSLSEWCQLPGKYLVSTTGGTNSCRILSMLCCLRQSNEFNTIWLAFCTSKSRARRKL